MLYSSLINFVSSFNVIDSHKAHRLGKLHNPNSHGFIEVKIRTMDEGYDRAWTGHKHPAVQAVLRAYKEMGWR